MIHAIRVYGSCELLRLVVSLILNIWPYVGGGHLYLILIIPVRNYIIWVLLRYDVWLTHNIPNDWRWVLIYIMGLNGFYFA